MSIIPVYLSSFSSITPLYHGNVARMEIDRVDRHEKVDKSNKAQKSANENVEGSKRTAGALVVRSGDVVSSHGDVFSLYRNENTEEKSTQSLCSKGDTAEELTEVEKQQVNELKQRDAEVKAHEAAHLGAAGGLARGGASYEYQKGPDSRNYAVGGEVSIDSSPVTGDPNATIVKAQQIRSAALAPAIPSSQDHKVAAKASQMEAEARQELSKNDQNSQYLNIDTKFQTVGDEENTRRKPQLQYTTNTAVTKYAAQSNTVSFVTQSDFRTFACDN